MGDPLPFKVADASIIHVAYDHANATLFAENVRVRADDPFDVSMDLNKNLRTRSKSVGTYIDARDPANGAVATLQTVQLNDDRIINGIGRHLELDAEPKTWRLHVDSKRSRTGSRFDRSCTVSTKLAPSDCASFRLSTSLRWKHLTSATDRPLREP